MEQRRRTRHEGARDHLISFYLSAVLTIIAFIAVASGAFSKTGLILFIVVLALIQVVFQLFVWMHLKEKGNLFPVMGIVSGAFVTLTAVITAIYWMW
jgi:cytochrome c oxidase subunit 4